MPQNTTLKAYPVPKLAPTLTELNRVMKYILSDEDYLRFEPCLKDFQNNAGPKIQAQFEQLCSSSASNGNWSADLFLESMLRLRVPIPLSTSFAIMLEPDSDNLGQLERAASLLVATATLKQQPWLISELINANKAREMTQSNQILSVTRVPGEQTDVLTTIQDSTYVLVLRDGCAFRVDILGADDEPLPFAVILQQLQNIIENSENYSCPENMKGVLGLSALPRTTWAQLRTQLSKSPENADAIACAENAILVLCLEDEISPVDTATALEALRVGSIVGNRYYDKPVNIVVFADGNAGLVFEHTIVDGWVALQFCEAMCQLVDKTKPLDSIRNDSNANPFSPSRLPLAMDEKDLSLLSNIPADGRAVYSFHSLLQSDALNALEQTGLLQVWIAVSVQLALRRLRAALALKKNSPKPLIVMPRYMGHFIDGRTDPVYVGTDEVDELLDAMESGSASQETQLQLFHRSTRVFHRLATATQRGRAFGPHLAALRTLAEREPPTAAILEYLRLFREPQVMLTGVHLNHIRGALGNVYASEQLVIFFVKQDGKVAFNLGAKGQLANGLPQMGAALEASLQAVATTLAVPAAMAQIMMPTKTALQIPSSPDLEPSNRDFTLVIHGGAGELAPKLPHERQWVEFCLHLALTSGSRILSPGGSALDAVQAAVEALEDCFIFNAGKGSVFNSHGEHELEAAVVDGASRKCGAVACTRELKHPVQGARLVMDTSPYYLLSGPEADRFCAEAGLQQVDNTYFHTALRRKQLNHLQPVGTVGAVAVDHHGRLAAACSTGGVAGKPPGRIGDTAMVGAGLYADDSYAVACTGTGELFIKHVAAKAIATKAEQHKPLDKDGSALQTACDDAIKGTLKEEGVAGVVAVGVGGEVAISFNCGTLFAGIANASGKMAKVMTSDDPYIVLQPEDCDSQSDSIARPTTSKVHGHGLGLELEPKLQLWSGDGCSALLDRRPVTPGVILLCPAHPDLASDRGLLGLGEQAFIGVLRQAKRAAQAQKAQFGVKRSALLCEGVLGAQGEYGKVIPLYGLPEQWAPIEAMGSYTETDKGTVDTREGPRRTDQEMDELQARVLAHNSEAGSLGSTTFLGEPSDDSLFARFVRGEAQAWRIWEDEAHVAFLTPFPNTPGFTVLVPRLPLDSDVLALPEDPFNALMLASRKVAALLNSALGTAGCALALEGMGIDYCHVKLIPLHAPPKADVRALRERNDITAAEEAWPEGGKYSGYITSALGPKASGFALANSLRALRPGMLCPPKSWRFPDKHAISALRDPWYRALFQLQNALYHTSVEYFQREVGFGYAMTPLTTDTISSPMGLGSDSDPVKVKLFGEKVYLADSMQFVLEYFLRLQEGLPGTYYISPSFRGEDSDSTHLNQFYHVECEVLGGMDTAIAIAEGYLLSLCQTFLRSEKLSRLIRQIAGTDRHLSLMIAKLQSGKLRHITMDQAVALLQTGAYGPLPALVEEVMPGQPVFGQKLTRAGEKALMKEYGGVVWLTEMDHLAVPFYQAYTDTNKRKARCADLLLGIGETLGLGERHLTAKDVIGALEHHQVPVETYSWYVDMRQEMPLHTSGWGMGSERFMCWLLQHDDVRDLHIIPRIKGYKFLP